MSAPLPLLALGVLLAALVGGLAAAAGGAVLAAGLAVLLSLAVGHRYAPGHGFARSSARSWSRSSWTRSWTRSWSRSWRRSAPRVGEGVPTFRLAYERLAWAEVSGRDYDEVVRPYLADLARARLVRHGVDLDADPVGAAALLGADVVELLAPVAVSRTTAHPGLAPSRLRHVVDQLEAL